MSLLSRIRNANVSGSEMDELSMDCPFCEERGKSPDTGGRFYVNIKSHHYFCHRCNISGKDVYRKIPELRYYQDEIGRGEFDFKKFFSNSEPTYFNLEEISEQIEPMDWAFNYLALRGLNLDQIRYYNIRKGIGDFSNRVIIPNLEFGSNKCNYFIARSVSKLENMKYRNPKVKRSNIVFNYSKALDFDLVWLTEGWFTGASYGTNFCSYLGSSINRIQARKISEFKNVYYPPDGDVSYEQIIKNIKVLLEFRRVVNLVPVKRIPKFDAENFTLNERRYTFINSLEIHKKDIHSITPKDLESYYEKIWKNY